MRARSRPLLPMFEAVINSIDAINDLRDDVSDHRIVIRLLRESSLFTGDDADSQSLPAVCGFEIVDDGIGFTEENFDAFNEADTQVKADRGGKGVGRFLWLKAFDRAEIKSCYHSDGQLMERSFKFTLGTPDGIGDHQHGRAGDADAEPLTRVRLLDFKEEYKQAVPRKAETIAQRIVEHCIEHFILGAMPRVQLVDETTDETIDLDVVYDDLVAGTEIEDVELRHQQFHVIHLTLNASSDLKHRICYCANRRVVTAETIATGIPNLPPNLVSAETGDAIVYAAYVTAGYLDDHVNQERTSFDTIPADTPSLEDLLTWSEIQEGVLGLSRRFLEPHTRQVKAEKEERIREYVSHEAPQYRYILKHHPEKLERIPADASGGALDTALHELQRESEDSLREEAHSLLGSVLSETAGEPTEEQLQEFSRFWEEYNEAGKAALAKYIVQRKLTLTLLQNSLERRESGKYPLEDVVHQMIFPMRSTSDELTYEQHNLWIIDERLAYHYYLASDTELRTMAPLESEDKSRPDLVVFFDRPIAVVEGEAPYSSGIVVFEFKRPMRKDYGADDNPIDQVLGYVQKIRESKAETPSGRQISIPDATPFYCYVVADLTENLKRRAARHGLIETPDGYGFFGYVKGLEAYIEVIGFDKLVRDARRRNRILFDKLKLPPALPENSGDDSLE